MAQTAIFTVTGMKCGGCESNVIEKLTALDGVISAVADCKENHVSVKFEPEKIDVDDLEDVIIAAGFGVE
jgi:copper chaperone CopZ